MNVEPIVRPDDVDWVDESGVVWLTGRDVEDETALECRNCHGAVDEGLVGSYCKQCIYLMDR